MAAAAHDETRDLDQRVLDVAEGMGLLNNSNGQIPRLLAVLCDPNTDSQQILGLLRMQPTLCVRVLRVANSAYYHRASEVGTIPHAVAMLGLDAVRGIAAAGCLNRAMLACAGRGPMPIAPLMRHSLATAALCETLAPQVGAPAGEAFMAGLMHHLGVAIQMCVDRDGTAQMVSLRQLGDDRPIAELEAQYTQASHTHCFTVIATRWKLPETMIEAVRLHHDPAAAKPDLKVSTNLLALSAQLALSCGYTYALEPRAGTPDPQLQEGLNLNEQSIMRACESVAKRIDELDTALRSD